MVKNSTGFDKVKGSIETVNSNQKIRKLHFEALNGLGWPKKPINHEEAMSLTRSAVTLPERYQWYHNSQSDTKRQICSIVNNKGKSTIGTETLPEYRHFSTVDVFHHSGHILFHDFFAFEASTYTLSSKRHLN